MATVHVLRWIGARPLFVDVDPKTWNVHPGEVRRAITDKTSGIVAVHTFGNPAEIEELEAIARQHGLRSSMLPTGSGPSIVDYQVQVEGSDVTLRVAAPPSLRLRPGEDVSLAVAPAACIPLAEGEG